MRQILTTIFVAGAVAATAPAAYANGGDKCFDKATLSYVDCNPVDWSGTYIGVHAGYAWADVEGDYLNLDYDSLDVEGLLAGGQIGYQEQFDSGLVLGLELDVSAVWADDSATSNLAVIGAAAATPYNIDAELDWLASARVRAGLSQGDWMPYLTAGVALAGYEASASTTVAAASVEETVFGGVVGGGVEVMLDRNWIAGVEGLYYFFDEETDLSAVGSPGDSVSFGDVGVVRARLSYKF